MATIDVKNATGATVAIEKPLAPGRAAATASRPVVLANEDLAAISGITSALGGTLTVDGSGVTQPVSISAPVAVTGTFWQATQPVSVAALPLPAGAATSAKQDSTITAINSVAAAISGATYYPATQPVSATTLPLPSGAATQATLAAIEAALGGTITVDGSGVTQPVSVSGSVAVTGTFFQATQPVSAAALPLPAGAATSAKQDNVIAAINGLAGTEYETVAASQTNQVLGAAGAAGDLLAGLLIIPASTSPGAVSIKDGAGSAITVFPGGADSVASLHPFPVGLFMKSASGAWSVSTGANVSVIATGNFS